MSGKALICLLQCHLGNHSLFSKTMWPLQCSVWGALLPGPLAEARALQTILFAILACCFPRPSLQCKPGSGTISCQAGNTAADQSSEPVLTVPSFADGMGSELREASHDVLCCWVSAGTGLRTPSPQPPRHQLPVRHGPAPLKPAAEDHNSGRRRKSVCADLCELGTVRNGCSQELPPSGWGHAVAASAGQWARGLQP